MFPRFLKWDIGALMNKIQGVDLAGTIGFQGKVDRLRSFDYEREVMGIDIEAEEDGFADINGGGEDCDGVDEHFMAEGTRKNESDDQVVQGRKLDVKRFTEHVDRNSGIERDSSHKLEEALIAVAELEMQNKKKDKMVSSLEEEVVGLKRKMELQAVNIVGGFECVVKMKNDELSKLKNENDELRKRVLLLEDQLEDRDVHDVTQRFREGVDIGVVVWLMWGTMDVMVLCYVMCHLCVYYHSMDAVVTRGGWTMWRSADQGCCVVIMVAVVMLLKVKA
ncbi:uncharacterized protein LOC114289493 [Camellia sinensis]|uniref:uncharacterized protein LOC114289493 n=1 Tax=Camellia sinensis TaxID=4442 RepID=UPI001036E0F9|nr:uncharacterized protein LOC114289493 [Camellia sinensis]